MIENKLAVRVHRENPDHHLWNNHGIWWCHYTVHLPDFTKQRVRLSLETRDVQEARKRRDSLLARFGRPAAPRFLPLEALAA